MKTPAKVTLAALVAALTLPVTGLGCLSTSAQNAIALAERSPELSAHVSPTEQGAIAPVERSPAPSSGSSLGPVSDADLSGALDLRVLEGAALARQPSLVAAAERVRATIARARAEGSLPPPELMAEVWQIPFARPYAIDKASMVMLSLRQQFPAVGSLDLAAEATALEAQAGAAAVAAGARAIVREVDRAFADYVEASELHQAHVAHGLLLARMAAAARARYATGAPLADVVKADFEQSRLDVHIAHEHAMIDEARARLNGLLARPFDAPLGPPRVPEIETVSLGAEALAQRAAATSPDVVAADLMERASRASAKAAEREAIVPSFLVGFDLFQPVNGTPFGYGGTFSMSLPWAASGGRNRADSAKHRAAAQHASAADARLRARAGVAIALADVHAAERQYVLLRDVVAPLAHRSLDATLAGYATRGSDLLAWLDAARAVLDVEVERITAAANLLRALADLDAAAGERVARAPLPSPKEPAHAQ